MKMVERVIEYLLTVTENKEIQYLINFAFTFILSRSAYVYLCRSLLSNQGYGPQSDKMALLNTLLFCYVGAQLVGTCQELKPASEMKQSRHPSSEVTECRLMKMHISHFTNKLLKNLFAHVY